MKYPIIFSAQGDVIPSELQRYELSVADVSVVLGEVYAGALEHVPVIQITLGRGDAITASDFIGLIQRTRSKDAFSSVQTLRAVEIIGDGTYDPLDQPNIMELLRVLDRSGYKTFVRTNSHHALRAYTGLRNTYFSLVFKGMSTKEGTKNNIQSLPFLRPDDIVMFVVENDADYTASMKIVMNVTTKARIVFNAGGAMKQKVFENIFQETNFARRFPREPLKVRVV